VRVRGHNGAFAGPSRGQPARQLPREPGMAMSAPSGRPGGGHDLPRQRHEADAGRDPAEVGDIEREGSDDHGRPAQKAGRHTARGRLLRPQPHHDRQLGDAGDHEPRVLERGLVRRGEPQGDEEGEQVEQGAQQAEDDHEAPHTAHPPALGPGDPGVVDVIGRDGDRRQIGEEVVEQDLLGRQRKETQEPRGQGHAHHSGGEARPRARRA
jgi:hypothetical protein